MTNRIATFSLAVAAGLGAALLRGALQSKRELDMRGRSVVITGGSRGLGLVMARELAAQGARLTICARSADELDRAGLELRAAGATVQTVVCDVREQAQTEELIRQAVEQYGGVDLLINNAGVIQTGPLEHMTEEDFADAMAVHFWGPLHTTLAVLPHMRQQGGGRIVNIASVGGKIAVPHLVPYSASKFALVGLSDGMRAELARENILVTTVAPGLLRTGSHRNARFKGRHEQEYAWFSIADALPISSIDAGRAARQIIAAARRGDPELTISIQAQVLSRINALLPAPTAAAMKLVARLLPSPTDASGDTTRTGWQSQSWRAPGWLTVLADQATIRNNGVPTSIALREEMKL